MNLYKVHNLPKLHSTLQMHVQYEIEGPYLATLMDSMYITLPTDIDVRLCLMTKGHLYMFNQALYPVDNTNWCIYALFINDINKIKKNCILKPLNRTPNLAYRPRWLPLGHQCLSFRKTTNQMCYGNTCDYHTPPFTNC